MIQVGEHPNEWFESSEAFFNQNTAVPNAMSPAKTKLTSGKSITPRKSLSSMQNNNFTPPPISSSKVKAEPSTASAPANTATAVAQN